MDKHEVCEDEMNDMLSIPLGEIFNIMKDVAEKKGVGEKEWSFEFCDVAFKIKVELKGDSVAE